MKKKSTIIYFISFVLITALSILILHHAKSNSPSPNKNIIDSFVNQATYDSYTKQGALKTRLTAARVLHNKSRQEIFFTSPQMLAYSTDHLPWRIEANQASSDDKMQKVQLTGNVIVYQLSAQNKIETKITTSTLTIFPKRSLATTSAVATVHRYGSVIHGTGLIANLKTGKYELLSQSAGVYTPNK